MALPNGLTLWSFVILHLIGSSTSRLITSYPISSEKQKKMAEHFPKVNEQEMRELIDTKNTV